MISSIVHIAHEYDNEDEPWPIQIEDHNGVLHSLNLAAGEVTSFYHQICTIYTYQLTDAILRECKVSAWSHDYLQREVLRIDLFPLSTGRQEHMELYDRGNNITHRLPIDMIGCITNLAGCYSSCASPLEEWNG